MQSSKIFNFVESYRRQKITRAPKEAFVSILLVIYRLLVQIALVWSSFVCGCFRKYSNMNVTAIQKNYNQAQSWTTADHGGRQVF